MKEIVFQGAIDPHTPIAQGWLRASHRKLDPKLTLPYRPYHTHDEKQPLDAGRAGRARHRDLADLDRGAGRLSHRAHGARQGLRVRRRLGRQAVELQERADGLRAVPARRSASTGRARSSAGRPRCILAETGRAICCCRSSRRTVKRRRQVTGLHRAQTCNSMQPTGHQTGGDSMSMNQPQRSERRAGRGRRDIRADRRRAAVAAGRPDQGRLAHRQDRPARLGRHPDGAGRSSCIFKESKNEAGRPQGRAASPPTPAATRRRRAPRRRSWSSATRCTASSGRSPPSRRSRSTTTSARRRRRSSPSPAPRT